jgi:4-fold beta-flower domain-containing protein
MRSLQDRNGKIRLWYGMSFLVDLGGNPVAIVKDGLIYSLKAEPVASWKFGNVIDLDGTTLLKNGRSDDGPGPRLVPLLVRPECAGDERGLQKRKPWGSELAFIETLRLVSRDFRLNVRCGPLSHRATSAVSDGFLELGSTGTVVATRPCFGIANSDKDTEDLE